MTSFVIAKKSDSIHVVTALLRPVFSTAESTNSVRMAF